MSNTPPTDPLAAEDRAPILTELRGLRGDVQQGNQVIEEERVGRRQSIRLTRVALGMLVGALAIVTAGGGYAVVQYVKATQITCESRTQSRADIRAGIEAAADEVADYAQVSPDQRSELNERVAARVAEKVGPPDC